MKQLIKKIPLVNSIARTIYHDWINNSKSFTDSKQYWIERYNFGANSGDGSYGNLSHFKAEVINEFVNQNNIQTVIEYGCGDGNQLKLANYPSYIGFDISPKAISLCQKTFFNDQSKVFKLVGEYSSETAELNLSLDCIYHLIEDEVFDEYMNRLFTSAIRFVIIYSSDTDVNLKNQAKHVKHRKFSKWVDSKFPEWRLIKHIKNKYPFTGDTKTGSFADFFIYEKI